MTTKYWTNPADGEWTDDANWTGGVPSSSDDADIATGSDTAYTVSVDNLPTITANDVILDDVNASVDIANQTTLQVSSFTLQNGTLSIGGTLSGTVNLQGGIIVLLGGSLLGPVYATGGVLEGGSSQTGGLDGVDWQGTLQISTVAGTVNVENGLSVTPASGTGLGVIDMTAAGPNYTVGSATLSFLDAETLVADLHLAGGNTVLANDNRGDFEDLHLDGTVEVSGEGSTSIIADTLYYNANTTSFSTYTGMLPSGKSPGFAASTLMLTLTGYTDVINTATINSGVGSILTIESNNGTVTNYGTINLYGSVYSGSNSIHGEIGTLTPSFVNNGTINIEDATLFTSDVGGTGTINIDDGDISAGDIENTINFFPAGGFVQASQITGTITGFNSSDSIKISTAGGASAVWSDNVLTVSDSNDVTLFTLNIQGDYEAAQFSASTDGTYTYIGVDTPEVGDATSTWVTGAQGAYSNLSNWVDDDRLAGTRSISSGVADLTNDSTGTLAVSYDANTAPTLILDNSAINIVSVASTDAASTLAADFVIRDAVSISDNSDEFAVGGINGGNAILDFEQTSDGAGGLIAPKLTNAGYMLISGNLTANFDGGTLDNEGYVEIDGSGTLDLLKTTGSTASAQFVNNGILYLNSSQHTLGTTSLLVSVAYSGSGMMTEVGPSSYTDPANAPIAEFVSTVDGTTTFQITDAVLNFDSTVSGGTVEFNDGHGLLGIYNNGAAFSASIEGFQAGDAIRFNGITGTAVTWSNGTLTVTGTDSNGQATTRSVALAGNYSPSDFSLQSASGITEVDTDAPCYCQGTLIRTSFGDVAVEQLAVGDKVVTSSGAHRPIRWLGHRTINCRLHPNSALVMPICIAAQALGVNKPARDLYVSPAHAICIDVSEEVLIPASALVNGTTILQLDVKEVTYWHIELESHDIIIAENQPAESYLDMGNRIFFQENDVVALDASPDGPMPTLRRTYADYCRPVHDGGPLLNAIRQQIRTRSFSLGWTLDQSLLGDLHLLVDGTRVDPVTRGLSARFAVPAGADDVWLVSNTSRPIDVTGAPDARRLGACLAGLSIDDGFGHKYDIGLTDPLLRVGLYALEEGSHRWTSGRARLPAELWADCDDGLFLRVDLAGPAVPRWMAPDCKSYVETESVATPRRILAFAGAW